MLWILSITNIIVPKSDQGHDGGWSLGVVSLPWQLELFNYFSNITWAERLVQFLSVCVGFFPGEISPFLDKEIGENLEFLKVVELRQMFLKFC
jgi:hypothetical protein